LYAKYHPQGAEFIGVSLDQPQQKVGLDSLKKFVEEKKDDCRPLDPYTPWPRHEQSPTASPQTLDNPRRLVDVK
jgi:hypothetical protein